MRSRLFSRLSSQLLVALARLALSPLAWLERRPRRDVHLALAGHYWQLLRALPEF